MRPLTGASGPWWTARCGPSRREDAACVQWEGNPSGAVSPGAVSPRGSKPCGAVSPGAVSPGAGAACSSPVASEKLPVCSGREVNPPAPCRLALCRPGKVAPGNVTPGNVTPGNVTPARSQKSLSGPRRAKKQAGPRHDEVKRAASAKAWLDVATWVPAEDRAETLKRFTEYEQVVLRQAVPRHTR